MKFKFSGDDKIKRLNSYQLLFALPIYIQKEEALAKNILDKINLIGDDKGGLYLFDNDIKQLIVTPQTGF